MKSFIYTRKEHTPRNGHTVYTVRIYRVIRGVPKYVGGGSDTFVSDFQQFMDNAKRCKLLPKRAFESNHFGGYKYGAPHSLRDAGIANVTAI